MNQHAKEIGRLIAQLACHDIPLPECAALIQAQLDVLELNAWRNGMTDAAAIHMAHPPSEHWECNKAILTARDERKEV